MEANGQLDDKSLQDDLGFIFPDGYQINEAKEGLKGHLLPLKEKPKWPDNIAPLGRFACWDSRATTDVTLKRILNLIEAEKNEASWSKVR